MAKVDLPVVVMEWEEGNKLARRLVLAKAGDLVEEMLRPNAMGDLVWTRMSVFDGDDMQRRPLVLAHEVLRLRARIEVLTAQTAQKEEHA